MRLAFALTVVLLAAAALPATAADTAQQSTMKGCAAKWSGMSAADKGKTKYKDYMSGCMKTQAAAPAPAAAMTAKPAAPMAMAAKPASVAKTAGGGKAKCKDGTIVSYQNRSGTCSGHKGVATWM